MAKKKENLKTTKRKAPTYIQKNSLGLLTDCSTETLQQERGTQYVEACQKKKMKKQANKQTKMANKNNLHGEVIIQN